MKDKRVIGYFAAGLLTAAALYGIYVLVHPMTGGDDEPIVVAGGSLDIGSINGWKKDPQDSTGYTALHKHTKRKVSVGLIGADGAPVSPVLPAGPTHLEIAYCKDLNCDPDKPDDKITVKTKSDGTRLTLSSSITNKDNKIGDEADAADASGSTTISHQPHEWHVTRIRDIIHGKDYTVHTGICQIVLIYHCNNSGHCQ